jgi:hypothetical protein
VRARRRRPPLGAGREEGLRPRAITIYRIAPGKQLDFLKWLAIQDETAKEAGIPTVQLYAHLDGAAGTTWAWGRRRTRAGQEAHGYVRDRPDERDGAGDPGREVEEEPLLATEVCPRRFS